MSNLKTSLTPPSLSALSADDEKKHRWLYGQIGQALFDASNHVKKLLGQGCKFTDGHEPRIKFSNLKPMMHPHKRKPVMHLDTIIYETRSKRICSITEVKTTSNRFKMDFKSNGVCTPMLQQARAAGIPIFLAVVRVRQVPPLGTLTVNCFKGTLQSNPGEPPPRLVLAKETAEKLKGQYGYSPWGTKLFDAITKHADDTIERFRISDEEFRFNN
jgi:hypothetical protein